LAGAGGRARSGVADLIAGTDAVGDPLALLAQELELLRVAGAREGSRLVARAAEDADGAVVGGVRDVAVGGFGSGRDFGSAGRDTQDDAGHHRTDGGRGRQDLTEAELR